MDYSIGRGDEVFSLLKLEDVEDNFLFFSLLVNREILVVFCHYFPYSIGRNRAVFNIFIYLGRYTE